MCKNNILSYFIKDIKDPIELAKYSQYDTDNFITIYNNDKIIFVYNKLDNSIHDLKNNIYKSKYIHSNNKIYYAKYSNYKQVSYYKDNKIETNVISYISYSIYVYNKFSYLCKQFFSYKINNMNPLIITIEYYNGFKYMYYDYKYNDLKIEYKSQILIMNKYELHYISRFFLSLLCYIIMCENNILSYFIKDIKDPIELAKYCYFDTKYFIHIYKNIIFL